MELTILKNMASLLLLAVLAMLTSLYALSAPIDEVATLPPNAFTWYAIAGKMIDSTEREQLGRQKTLSHAEKRALLAKLSPVLATVRIGFNYSCRMPRINSLQDKMPWLQTGRDIARLFALESTILAEDRNYLQATMSGLDTIHFGRDYSSGAPMISHLVGIALQSIGRESLWEYLPKLDSSKARKVTTRIEMITTPTIPYVEVLQEEKRIGMSVLQEFLDHPEVFRQTLEKAVGKVDASNELMREFSSALVSDALKDYPKQIDAAVAMIQSSYPHWETLPESNNLLSQIFLPDFRRGGFKSLANDVQNRLLYISFALRAYQQEHKQYPETLSNLSPDYLLTIPLDPFADSLPFKYLRTNTGYLLYSIGPDARDDAGKAIDDPQAKERRYHALLESTGDIVAGVNIN